MRLASEYTQIDTDKIVVEFGCERAGNVRDFLDRADNDGDELRVGEPEGVIGVAEVDGLRKDWLHLLKMKPNCVPCGGWQALSAWFGVRRACTARASSNGRLASRRCTKRLPPRERWQPLCLDD